MPRALMWWLRAAVLLAAFDACASDIGVTPVAVHLDKANDRATVSVVNNGSDAVIMQVEAIAWQREGGADRDAPTGDMVINPSVFTVAPGQAQIVRVGLRRAAQEQREATYRIVLREVPAPPQPGDVRVSGQVRVLMALRVPVYVAPVKVVRDFHWQAAQQADGSIVASLSNQGNVHVRVGRIQLRSTEGQPVTSDAMNVAAVVFPGESHSFRLRAPTASAAQGLAVDVATDDGAQTVPVALAAK